MFTDATRVVINNKEVQSITTSNGGVIYNAYEPYTCLIQTDGHRQLTITNLTTGNPVTITNNQCQLNVGNNYQFQAIHPKGEVDTFEELVTYQGEGYYRLISVDKKLFELTFYGKPL